MRLQPGSARQTQTAPAEEIVLPDDADHEVMARLPVYTLWLVLLSPLSYASVPPDVDVQAKASVLELVRIAEIRTC